MLRGHGRDRDQLVKIVATTVVVAHRHRSSVPVILQGYLALRNMRLCTQGGLGSSAFIAITRHIQVPTRQLAVCEFGMNILVCVCVCGLLLLRFGFNVLCLVLALAFEE
jgi:hypothetical protein